MLARPITYPVGTLPFMSNGSSPQSNLPILWSGNLPLIYPTTMLPSSQHPPLIYPPNVATMTNYSHRENILPLSGYPLPIYPTSRYPPPIHQVTYALYSLQCPSTIQTTHCVRWVVSYHVYDKDLDLDAHVIAFERALWANGETKATKIINMIGTTLKKGP